MRRAWNNAGQQRFADDVENRLDRLDRKGRLASRLVSKLTATYDVTTNGVQVNFSISSLEGVDSLVLLRNTTRDVGTAKVLTTYPSNALLALSTLGFSFTDSDPALAGATACYWVRIVPAQAPETAQLSGPATAQLPAAGNSATPQALVDFDAWKSAGASGLVTIGVQALAAKDGKTASIKIYITGYQGVGSYVAIAQSGTWPFTFALQQTGEAVTLKAIAVDSNGNEATTGPTKNLTLNAGATVPAKIENIDVAELSTGVQVGFLAGLETDISNWQIWRGPRGGGFGAASNIGTVNPSAGTSRYTFLDTNGLGGQYEWYVVATNPTGSSAASSPFLTGQSSFTSADSPPNEPTNNLNQATVDSIDAGSNATIRVYGTGGVNSNWTRTTGYGTETYPHAQLTGFNYSTTYYVMYDKKNAVYVVNASPLSVIPDNYVWAGKVTTVAAGGGGGATGGGGAGGGTSGCVRKGTPIELDPSDALVSEEDVPCYRWARIKLADGREIQVSPETLVAVWKKARELRIGERLDASAAGDVELVAEIEIFADSGVKVKRVTAPSHTYRARGIRLHNYKLL